MTTPLDHWLSVGGALSRWPGPGRSAPRDPAAGLATAPPGRLLTRYAQLLRSLVVMARPDAAADPEDWARMRAERDRLEAALCRRQRAYQARGRGADLCHDPDLLAYLVAAPAGGVAAPEGPAARPTRRGGRPR